MAAPLISDVSDTSFRIAHHRAVESARPDALFREPFAARLAGEHGRDIAAGMPGGIFVIVVVARDWNRFFEHPKAKFLVDAFGRRCARIFYGVRGCALLLAGRYCRQCRS